MGREQFGRVVPVREPVNLVEPVAHDMGYRYVDDAAHGLDRPPLGTRDDDVDRFMREPRVEPRGLAVSQVGQAGIGGAVRVVLDVRLRVAYENRGCVRWVTRRASSVGSPTIW